MERRGRVKPRSEERVRIVFRVMMGLRCGGLISGVRYVLIDRRFWRG